MDGSSEKFLDLLIKDNFAKTIHTANTASTAPFAPSGSSFDMPSVSTYESSIALPHTNTSSSRTVELALQIQALQAQVADLPSRSPAVLWSVNVYFWMGRTRQRLVIL
ncbi:hypothetical protein VTO73DRAFT_4344 [Trametes versicolor]